jgi:hypothetical protein
MFERPLNPHERDYEQGLSRRKWLRFQTRSPIEELTWHGNETLSQNTLVSSPTIHNALARGAARPRAGSTADRAHFVIHSSWGSGIGLFARYRELLRLLNLYKGGAIVPLSYRLLMDLACLRAQPRQLCARAALARESCSGGWRGRPQRRRDEKAGVRSRHAKVGRHQVSAIF